MHRLWDQPSARRSILPELWCAESESSATVCSSTSGNSTASTFVSAVITAIDGPDATPSTVPSAAAVATVTTDCLG